MGLHKSCRCPEPKHRPTEDGALPLSLSLGPLGHRAQSLASSQSKPRERPSARRGPSFLPALTSSPGYKVMGDPSKNTAVLYRYSLPCLEVTAPCAEAQSTPFSVLSTLLRSLACSKQGQGRPVLDNLTTITLSKYQRGDHAYLDVDSYLLRRKSCGTRRAGCQACPRCHPARGPIN